MTDTVYDDDANKIEYDPEKLFTESHAYKIYILDDSHLLKLYSYKTIPKEIKRNLDLIQSTNINIQQIILPKNLVFSDSGAVVGYTMRKPQGENILRSIFIKSQFHRLFPVWDRSNLINLCISLLNLIKQLHRESILIGNLNPKSIFIKSDTDISIINPEEFVYLKNIENKSEFDYERDDFIMAVFIYMILIPGKPPFQVKLGTNAIDNLLKMFQNYSISHEFTWKQPEDEDKYLWNSLPEDIRTSFHSIFNKEKRFTEDMWIQLLGNFKTELLEKKPKIKIFKKKREKDSIKFTTSMNLHEGGIGSDRTVLSNDTENGCKIAVLELSTKAVKLLIGNKSWVNAEFQFDLFSRSADLTNTGKGLDDNNHMNLTFFENSVAPSIEKFLNIANESNVSEIFTVATAAYRAARNNDEILSLLKRKFDLNVRILTKEEEAQASFDAFVFSGHQFIQTLNDSVILIDQGGGSTEISFFNNLKLEKSISLNLGTTVLQNILLNKSNLNLSLSDALHETDDILFSRIEQYFEDIPHYTDAREYSCIALGSAITNATDMRSNKQQHGIRLNAKAIHQRIEATERDIIRNFRSINDLMSSISRENYRSFSFMENLLIMRLGLPMYLKIFDIFGIDELVVSGTGLWYGIFWQKCQQP